MLPGYLCYQLSLLVLTGFIALVIGKGVLADTAGLDRFDTLLLSTATGTGVMILVLFLLGVFKLLTLPVILVAYTLLCLAALARIGWRDVTTHCRACIRQLRWRHGLVLLPLLVILVPVVLTPVSPPMLSDEIRYHLPYALRFADSHGLEPDLALRYPFFTLNIDLFYTWGLLLGDDVTPHFLHLYFALLTALGCYGLTRKFTNRTLALGAFLLFLTLPAVTLLTASAYIDIGLACFLSLSLYGVYCLGRSRNTSLLIASALLFGVALGSKYLALAYLPIMIAWSGYYGRRVKTTLWFTAIALVAGCPWYLYNYVQAGNPISPFGGNLFGYWPFTEADMLLQQQDLASKGGDRSLTGLLALPYNLLVNARPFEIPQSPLLLIPALFMIPFTPWLRKSIQPWFLLLLCAVLVWFYTSQSFRYLTAILPVWCFLAAWTLHALAGAAVRLWPAKALPARHPALLPGLVLFAGIAYQYWTNPYLLSVEDAGYRVNQRETFLAGALDEYGLVRFLRENGISGATIFQVRAGALSTYRAGNRIIGDVFGVYGYAGYVAKYAADKTGFIEEQQDNGVDYLVFRQNFLRNQPDWGDYLLANLDIRYQDDDFVLFAMPGR